MHDSYHHICRARRIDELSRKPYFYPSDAWAGADLMALCGEHCRSASHKLVLVLRTADPVALTVSTSL